MCLFNVMLILDEGKGFILSVSVHLNMQVDRLQQVFFQDKTPMYIKVVVRHLIDV